MRIVIAGGSGSVGSILDKSLTAAGHSVLILSRTPSSGQQFWDGKSLGDWAQTLDGADIVINLAGRSVNCRGTTKNIADMLNSRVDSTRVIGQAIAAANRPPTCWLQASTATIYTFLTDRPQDEITGVIGGSEPNQPRMWRVSLEIAKAWEAELENAITPATRKIALRSSLVMGVQKNSVFDVLARLALLGLAGTQGSGRQWVSWIHEDDFAGAVKFLIDRNDLSGPFNICSPNPIQNREFYQTFRSALGIKLGLPATSWMLEIGAFFMKTETELLLKSRRAIPTRLLESGFQFRHPQWAEASKELADRWNTI